MLERTEIIIPASVTEDMREILRILSNIANNCNQIAHALNIANQAGLISDILVKNVLSKVSDLLENAWSNGRTKC